LVIFVFIPDGYIFYKCEEQKEMKQLKHNKTTDVNRYET
jgi:hypothetical protein